MKRAAKFLLEALKIFQDIQDDRGVYKTLVNLGILYKNSGYLNQAIEILTEAVNLASNVGDGGTSGLR